MTQRSNSAKACAHVSGSRRSTPSGASRSCGERDEPLARKSSYAGANASRILAVPREQRERDEVRERVRVRVEANVDEVRDVRPAEPVAVRAARASRRSSARSPRSTSRRAGRSSAPCPRRGSRTPACSNRAIIVWRKIDAIALSARSARSIARVDGSSSCSISRSTARSCANVDGTSASARPVWYERYGLPLERERPVHDVAELVRERDDVAQLVGVVHEDVREDGLRDRAAVRAADLAGARLRVDVRRGRGSVRKMSPSRGSKSRSESSTIATASVHSTRRSLPTGAYWSASWSLSRPSTSALRTNQRRPSG